jgi:hypothetical protein
VGKFRQEGQPTSDSKALDVDVTLAAQASLFGAAPGEVVIVTTNPKQLARFSNSKHWTEILP